jgi:hypothetical protein
MISIDKYPTDGTTNENVLFSSLGAFWTQVFSDQAALRGLTLANAEEVFQTYYDLIEAIDSYSANSVAVFKKIKWLPLMIKKSELNSNILKFGEGATFGDTPSYIFGAPKPQGENIFVVPLPEDLREMSIIANRVISPSFVLVNNIDVQVKGEYLYFYGDPFQLPNINKFNLVDDTGNQVYYTNSLGQPIPDEVLVLWVYNGKINTQSLNYNIGYLFGVNLPISQQSKDILAATVRLYSGGPTVQQLKAICGAFLGIKPILEETEAVVDLFETDTHTILTTDKHVYRYDLYYTLNSGIHIGSILSAGDVPVDAVEFYDNVAFRDWWRTRMIPKAVSDMAAESGTTPSSPSITLPPYMFIGNYKYGLTFNNDMELITRAADGTINFPVTGNDLDVAKFQQYINQSQNLIAKAVTGSDQVLQPGSAMLINPLAFIFKTIFSNNTALMKINFKTMDQLQMFTGYFDVIKACLPKHVYTIFLCDLALPTDVYTTDNVVDTSSQATNLSYFGDTFMGSGSNDPGDRFTQLALDSGATYNSMPGDCPVSIHFPYAAPTAYVSMNSAPGGTEVVCKELVIVRTIPNGVTSRDYNTLDITKLPA